ncbi:MAG: tetratricopeptide repeat protein [Salinivirgaceae bacterium]|nr:tetratricopeptide repeat protein [Salinivirgaceae bacterium]
MKKLLFISILVYLHLHSYGQNIDSLISLSNSKKTDVKVSAYLQLSSMYLSDSIALANSYNYQALKHIEKLNDNILIGDIYYQKGEILINLQEFDSALYNFKAAENAYIKTKDFDKIYSAKLKKCKISLKVDDYESAKKEAQQLLKIALKINNQDYLKTSYTKLAKAYFLTSAYDSANYFLHKKSTLDSILNDSIVLANNYINISANYRRLGKYIKAVNYAEKGINIFRIKNDSLGMSDSYLTLGAIYYYNDDYEKAIQYFVKASDIVQALGDTKKLAGLFNNIGSVYNELEEYKMATLYFKKAYNIYKEINFTYAIAVVSGNLSLSNEGLGDLDKAISYAEESLKLQKQIDNSEGIINSLTNIAGIEFKMKKISLAKKSYERALKMAIDGNYIHAQKNIYEKLIEVEEQLGNYKKALDVNRKYQLIKDSLITEESRTQLNEMQSKLKLYEHKIKIQLLEKENIINIERVKKQRLISISAIIVVLLFLILILVIYRALRFSRNAKKLLEKQRNEIQIKNKQFTDSITYARRVQNALFTPLNSLDGYFADYFLISNPQNIVSGDFHWHKFANNKLYVAVADCTGHGVPGAFMSTLGNALLNDIVKDKCTLHANEVLNELRNEIKKALHQNSMNGNTDGMDISLCVINKELKHIEYAGAYNPIYKIRNNELTEIKGDKMPISISRNEYPYTIHEINFENGDQFYLSSDGFYDQFGGNNYQKITRKKFKDLLLEITNDSMQTQADKLKFFFFNWKSKNEQTDDMMVFGFKF